MSDVSSLADRYERMYPGTDLPDAQKEERMQRELFKHRNPGRPNRRGKATVGRIVVPDVPWKRGELSGM